MIDSFCGEAHGKKLPTDSGYFQKMKDGSSAKRKSGFVLRRLSTTPSVSVGKRSPWRPLAKLLHDKYNIPSALLGTFKKRNM